jgi:hypothetical protein
MINYTFDILTNYPTKYESYRTHYLREVAFIEWRGTNKLTKQKIYISPYHCMAVHLAWAGFKLSMLVVTIVCTAYIFFSLKSFSSYMTYHWDPGTQLVYAFLYHLVGPCVNKISQCISLFLIKMSSANIKGF